ncbi:MAG TPA: hypothetical protein VMZ92_21800, partial [Planctomycetota bacterium]|nr:hypothetical protein [Planctomycetota bacterium]
MMNRFTVLLAFLAVFMITTPAFAGQPETDAKADDAKAEGTADDAKTEEKADEAKADEAKADEAKADDVKTDDVKTDEKADGPAEIKSDEEAVEAVGGLLKAIQTKHWGLAVGLGLSLLVFGLRKAKVLAKVPAKALPWVTAVLGVVGYVAAAMMVEGADLMDAAMGGAMTGAAAVGLWEMVLKNFLGATASEGGSGE